MPQFEAACRRQWRNSVDKLNADYLQIRNSQAQAKLKLAQLRVGEQEQRFLPVAYIQALLSDSLVQLRQHMMSVPAKFRTQFRTVDAVMVQRGGDWLRDDINRALTRASEIEPALLSEDPFARGIAITMAIPVMKKHRQQEAPRKTERRQTVIQSPQASHKNATTAIKFHGLRNFVPKHAFTRYYW